jgi:hypothetical protein
MNLDPGKHARDVADEATFRKLGEEAFGLHFGEVVKSGSVANTMGIRTKEVLFSRRLDSRTYFVQDSRFGTGREAGCFRGTDEELLGAARKVLESIGIPSGEFGPVAVVQEHLQVASFDPVSKATKIEPPEKGDRFARIARCVGGVPVWQSSCLLGLTAGKQVGFLQLHWPEIPAVAVAEAIGLAHRLQDGWQVPACAEAVVESSEAGIVHSHAIGFVMDISAAIRVIYRPLSKGIGKKPVQYFDRHGKEVPAPRDHAWDLGEIIPGVRERVKHSGK